MGVKEARVEFRNQFGEKLVGTLATAGTPTPNTVVMCHGLSDHRDGFIYKALAAALAAHKFNSLRIDFSGNGDSDGVFEYGNYLKEVQEIRCAVKFLEEQKKLKVQAIVGHSKGGNDVLLYAAKYDDVPIVVNVAGRFDMTRGITERFGEDVFEKLDKFGQVTFTWRNRKGPFKWSLTKKSMDERLHTDMAAAAAAITMTEVLTVHGSADTTIPVADAHALARLIKPHTLHVVEGADHNFTDPQHADAAVKKITDFIAKGL